MKVPFFSHTREIAAHREVLMGAIEKAIHSPTLILGEHVRCFEETFAGTLDLPHAVGVASGTDALTLALRALDIGSGDEVITIANTCVATVAAIRLASATPRFVDIDPETLLMDTEKIETAITEKTKAILPVHLYGNPVPMEQILMIAERHHLRVIEDCAQAYGARIGDMSVGTFGDIAAFSFYPTKNLGGWGDGGMCVTGNAALAERLRRLRVYGCKEPYFAEEEGTNSRLDALQAAILLAKLRYAEHDLARRRAIAEQYDAAIAGTRFSRPRTTAGAEHAFHLYVLRVGDRERVAALLQERGISTLVHYPHPIHLMPAYHFLGYRRGDFPLTEQAMQEILSIPLFPYLTEEEVRYIGETLHAVGNMA